MRKELLESAIVALGEVGNRLDDSLDAARLEQARYDGAKHGLIEARKKVEDHLSGYIKKDAESGEITISEHTLVAKYIKQCIAILDNLTISAEVQSYQGQGKIMGLESAVRQARHSFDVNKGKYEALLHLELHGEKARPEEGTSLDGHPGNPIADRREEVPPETTPVPTGKKKK